MRFDSVGLLRYGHFTDRTLAFPAAQAHDFQLIVGHNEAGKSTLRAALRDLLFGIPMTTPMSFGIPGPSWRWRPRCRARPAGCSSSAGASATAACSMRGARRCRPRPPAPLARRGE